MINATLLGVTTLLATAVAAPCDTGAACQKVVTCNSNQTCQAVLLACAEAGDTGAACQKVVTCSQNQPCQTVVLARATAGDTGQADAPMVWVSDDGTQHVKLVKVLDEATADSMPRTWIGVRVSPVPAALASHLKRDGLMIGNIVADSPADLAGLEQYDVIVSFDGAPIAEMSDLLDAVGAADGKNVEVVLIRGGEETAARITPIERDATAVPTFKYDEPDVAMGDPSVQYFGHRLQKIPGGAMILQPHGRIDVLPDNIKDLLNDIDDVDVQTWTGTLDSLDNVPFGMKIEIDSDDDGHNFVFGNGAWFGTDAGGELTIEIDRDDEGSIRIHRTEEGIIEVRRVDPDGNVTETTYENADELREDDLDAWKVFNDSAGGRMQMLKMLPPDLDSLHDMQFKFQCDLQDRLHDAHQRVEEALERARQSVDDANRKVQVHTRMRQFNADDDDGDLHTREVMIKIDDDGHITLSIEEDGVLKKYEFESREDFKKAEPELYREYGEQLGQATPGTRVEIVDVASEMATI